MNEINDIQMNEVLEDDTAPNEAPESEEATEALPEPELNDQETITTLKEELERLRLELSNTRAVHERLSKECEEFSELYPSVPMTTLPDSIWKSFKEGVPLAAAYALYEKRRLSQEKRLQASTKKTEGSLPALCIPKATMNFSRLPRCAQCPPPRSRQTMQRS